MKYRLLFLATTLLFSSLSSSACSAIFIKKNVMLLGKNFDWYNGKGMVIKNNRGVKKSAYGIDTKNLVQWTSKYGSITFNQVGKEFPYGGVNERGLAVEMLWSSNAHYEENGRPTISELEWIQFQLDNYKTAAEVAYYLDSININPIMANLHYIASDHGGRSYVIEFINGKGKAYPIGTAEYQALTNTGYASSVNYYEKQKDSINTESRKSTDRFCQLSSKYNEERALTPRGLFSILDESAEDKEDYKTYWTIVYDLLNYKVYYKTHEGKRLKAIELRVMDFSNSSPQYSSNMSADFLQWERYSSTINQDLLNTALDSGSIQLNRVMANKHMMNPAEIMMDDVYSLHHKDLKIKFNVKKQKGYLFYTLVEGHINYMKFKGTKSGMLPVKNNLVEVIHYSLPIKEYAVASFHDLDGNFKMNKFLGIPSEPIGFSNEESGWFGSSPSYEKVKFDLNEDNMIEINIK